ncbi:uncharacterized protein LOC34622105, partial [Cyclospora cayetanensis]|uniref:Uncharacterized protein LOC34622105 n=1 Tax=Cyclospora cayetanensis TaxID=88456 RepID=A0A6P6S0H8_9EIME
MSVGLLSEFQLGLQSLLVAADSRHERRGGNTAPADAAPGGNAKDGLFELVLTEPGAQESAWQYCEGGMAPLSSPRSFASSRSISSECEGVRRRRSSCDGAEDEADSAAKGGQKPRHSRPSEDDKSGCDPPHLEIISRFQRLKEIRHPHLCAYTHILRKQSRVYLVSEQWSLSLEDIMRAWERDGELHAGGSAESTPLPGNAPSCDLPKEGDNEEGAGGRSDHEAEASEEAEPNAEAAAAATAACCIGWSVNKLEFLATVATQTVTALAYLNSLGLAHNRLEPRTIRLSAHGNVQLSEWGLAYLTDGGRLAPSAALPASFAFLSPEQILAGPGVLSHTAACAKQDVWSLGIILLQILQPRWLLKKPLRGKGMLQQERPSHARDGACSCVSSLHSASRSASEARAGGGEAAEASSDALEPAEKGLKNITQLVLYCALAADFKCLLPLNPPAAEEATDATSEEEEGSNSSSQLKAAAAPSVCAFGTGLQGWLLERKPLLLEMMQKAIGAPCHMISPRAFRSALKATLPEVSIHCPKELSAALSERQQHDDGYPKAQSLLTPQCAAAVSAVSAAASPPPLLLAKAPTSGGHMTGAVNAEAAEAAEAALLLHCLEGLMRWLSGESLEASPRCLSARAPAPEERSRCSDSSESNILKPPQQDAVGNTDEGDHSETLQQELLRRRRSTLLRQIREFLRASLKIHPSCRASPGDLLALEWLQTPQRERQLWCLKGAECIGVLASLHVEEELRQVVGGERKERAGVPWLPYSCEGGSANKRELLLRNHNIGLDEVFYWWQLQGGDVHTSLLKQNAFRPVPPLFSLPLCCLWKQQKGQVLEASEPSTPHSARGASSLSRIEFLSAFADCRIHDFSEPEAACLNADREVCRCLFHEEKMPAPTPEAFQALQHTQAAPRPASGSLETEDSFFLTGFTSGRNWRDVHLWKEGDLRVF